MQNLVQITRYPRREYYELMMGMAAQINLQVNKPQLPLGKLTTRFSGNVVTDASEPVPECMTCGVCCAFPLIVPVLRSDSQKISSYWNVTLDEDNSVVIDRVLPRKIADGYCANLDGLLGKQVTCTAYVERPRPCREFEAGSDRCHEYRRMYGIEPLLSEDDVAAATGKLDKLHSRQKIAFVRILMQEMAFETIPLANGTSTRSKKTKLKIVAFLDDDAEKMHIIHTFDPSDEAWFESDFLAMSLDEAREMTASREKKVI